MAQRKYKTRQDQKPKYQSFTWDIKSKIEEGLSEDLSPEQIVGLSKKNAEKMVSVERIYQHIWQDKRDGGDWYTRLRTQGNRLFENEECGF